jgi:hypothetical protein
MKLQKLILASLLIILPSGGALAERSAADQALYERAVAACNGPKYPSGARPFINYAGGWFRCVEPRNR